MVYSRLAAELRRRMVALRAWQLWKAYGSPACGEAAFFLLAERQLNSHMPLTEAIHAETPTLKPQIETTEATSGSVNQNEIIPIRAIPPIHAET